jgi:hypothetical protein
MEERHKPYRNDIAATRNATLNDIASTLNDVAATQ